MDGQKGRNLLRLDTLQALDVNPFAEIQFKLQSMGRPRFHAMMNALACCMGPDEYYLECGTYQGGSMIGALLGNHARAIAVDDFHEFRGETQTENTRDKLETNLTAFGVRDRVSIFEIDYRQYFADFATPPIGLYYYDADHSPDNTTEGLTLGFPHVVPGGFIVADDIAWDMVMLGVNRFIGLYPDRLRMVFCTSPKESELALDPDWWNGAMVLQKIK